MDPLLERSLGLLNEENPYLFNRLYNWGRARTLFSPRNLHTRIPKTARHIVDVGCGSGMTALSLHFLDAHREIIGYDLNKVRIGNLQNIVHKHHLSKVRFACKDFTKDQELPTADVIMMNDLLHHIDTQSQIRLLRAAHEKLDTDGILLIKDIDRDFSYRHLITWALDMIITRFDAVHYRSLKEWTAVLKKLDFEIIEASRLPSRCYPHLLIVCRRRRTT